MPAAQPPAFLSYTQKDIEKNISKMLICNGPQSELEKGWEISLGK